MGAKSRREAWRLLALSLLPLSPRAARRDPRRPPALGAASRTYLGPGARAAAPGAAAAAAAGPRGACPSAGGSTRTERGLALPASRSPPLLLWLMLYPSRLRPVGKELAGTPRSVGFTKI